MVTILWFACIWEKYQLESIFSSRNKSAKNRLSRLSAVKYSSSTCYWLCNLEDGQVENSWNLTYFDWTTCLANTGTTAPFSIVRTDMLLLEDLGKPLSTNSLLLSMLVWKIISALTLQRSVDCRFFIIVTVNILYRSIRKDCFSYYFCGVNSIIRTVYFLFKPQF